MLLFSVTFLSREKKSNQKKTPVSRLTLRVAKPANDAAPHAAMRRCPTRSGAHNLAIAARLASLGRLAWQHDACFIDWFFMWSASELASLKQADALFPSTTPMLGAGQRDVNPKSEYSRVFWGMDIGIRFRKEVIADADSDSAEKSYK